MINHYYNRFKSETPAALKKLQKFFGVIVVVSGSISTSLAMLEGYEKYVEILAVVAAISTGIMTGLQFATSDKNLQTFKNQNHVKRKNSSK